MRRFEDGAGRVWEAVCGRESWGAFVAIFVPVAHDAPMRQALLHAVSYDAATAELDALDEAELVARFEAADARPTG